MSQLNGLNGATVQGKKRFDGRVVLLKLEVLLMATDNTK